ncbi:MAG TPA: phosphatidate cytidylyltransferase, partial [Burkholderiaceae bacterium]|nr:phosphatidate cytidylyltransferase [Burkholderiaceae bacterium]
MGALRNLTVSQQIGLLFVALFGVLVIVTAIAVGRTLRDLSDEQLAAHEQFKRDLRAIWIGAVLFWIAWIAGGIVSTLLFGTVSFLALREFVTLTHTVRGDHRSLLLAFFVVLPLQYVIVATEHFDIFSVFVPVYVFLAIPVISALGNDPKRFLERTAKIQWGVMVCVYGMSHAPALLLLDLPDYRDRGAFLVLYLVLVVAVAQIAQETASRRLRRRPVARAISRSFSWRAWGLGMLAGGILGAALYWATPFKPIPALVAALIAGGGG